MKALGEKGGREAGGAAADYRDITDTRERGGQAPSVRVLRRGLRGLGDRAAGVAADDGFTGFCFPDDLRPMAAALRTHRRRLRTFERIHRVLEMNHSVA